MLAAVNYFLALQRCRHHDDIDHLGNRRVRCAGELLQNQFRVGLTRMERVVRERMTIQDIDITTPQALINVRPVVGAIKEFFVQPAVSVHGATNSFDRADRQKKAISVGNKRLDSG